MHFNEKFISEAIKPVISTCDTSRMAIGEPGLPRQFVWHEQIIEIADVLRTWRDTGKCRHGSSEMYVRKHWYEVVTTADSTMKIYFERQLRRGQSRERWWLFSMTA